MTTFHRRRRGTPMLPGLVVLLLGTSASPLEACSIPVFRYALERWPSDPYEAIALHRGPLAAEHQAALKALEPISDEAPAPNLRVFVVDLAEEEADGPGKKLWEAEGSPGLPRLVVRYPRWSGRNATVWSGPLGAAAAKALVDSKARREIARRIVTGDSAVWILLESGDRQKDDAAKALLEAELTKLEKALEPPDLQAEDYRGFPGEIPELKVAFSILRLSRTDPAEQVLVKMLIGTEADLGEYSSEPMAFPVFGRGRVLFTLVGKGINADNIAEACAFLVGPCSCMVKAQNPGVDLLMTADWEGGAGEPLVEEVTLPPLEGLSESTSPEKTAEGAEAGSAEGTGVAGDGAPAGPPAEGVGTARALGPVVRNVLVVSALAILAVAAATMIVRRKRRRTGTQ